MIIQSGITKPLISLLTSFFYYNFKLIFKNLTVTPAMGHRITNHIWTWEEFLGISRQEKLVA